MFVGFQFLTGGTLPAMFEQFSKVPKLNNLEYENLFEEETMNFRGLFKVSAWCAIGYAAVNLASYVFSVSANGFFGASSKAPSAERIYAMLQLKGNHISLRLDLISYFLLIPSLVGLFAYLRERRPGRAHLGGAFAAFALLVFFMQTAMYSTAVGLARGPLTDSLRERLVAMDLLAFSLMLPALYSVAISNLLWGLALRTQTRLARKTGNLFLGQVIGFLIANAGFMAGQDVIGNVGIFLNILALVASFASTGALLMEASKEQAQTQFDAEVKPRAASASA